MIDPFVTRLILDGDSRLTDLFLFGQTANSDLFPPDPVDARSLVLVLH